ncbi:MAG: triosephosphate isomerase [Candidatus Marinimicrobia bacterium]|jgi:triosephosphate isomerase|nr:triosephosphate isomerase [Gammaproteobacteria bacterium]MBL6911385.1 triosephosphate isomerase [Candidatus Neomarinimicrobiota bacterium]MBT3728110.1 triosephosphate isomerase [Candidatus Neomarinimicrobiota bacterium]MBT3944289.1 triosephosphate isomerase [Candidatus Neomarinimicrobiota bacterium]MBT4112290.1 triosephosphate isomerase [Candidatus Neomarinimicrobiota bacterium]
MRKITLAANWKMYLDESNSISFIHKLNADKDLFSDKDIILFPSHACIRAVKDHLDISLKIGMQDCDMHAQGAYTGSTSINSIDIDSCIVGHSERRIVYKETNSIISDKLNTILSSNANPILCIGETLKEKNKNLAVSVLRKQLSILPQNLDGKELTIAYEPVWAIGSGDVPSNEYINEMLSSIKNRLKSLYSDTDLHNIKLFYGGSVDASNIEELLSVELIDGFLIGSASANFEKFKEIVRKIKL